MLPVHNILVKEKVSLNTYMYMWDDDILYEVRNTLQKKCMVVKVTNQSFHYYCFVTSQYRVLIYTPGVC